MATKTGHGEKLSRKRELALAALLAARTVEEAAAKAGIGARTLRSWMATAEFSAEYKRLRRELLDEAVSDLQAASGEAVQTLRRNLSCGKAGDEIKASVAILSLSLKALEVLDVAAKLAEIEARLRELKP